MIYRFLIFAAITILISGCTAIIKPDSATKPDSVSVTKQEKEIIGAYEPVRISPGDIILNARIDTGAKTTSLNAINIKQLEKDGKKWIRFQLNKDITIERPLIKYIRVKQHGTDSQRRPIVKMKMTLGDRSQFVDVTLVNRSKYTYKVLVGRNFLSGFYLVDVTRNMTTRPIPSREIK